MRRAFIKIWVAFNFLFPVLTFGSFLEDFAPADFGDDNLTGRAPRTHRRVGLSHRPVMLQRSPVDKALHGLETIRALQQFDRYLLDPDGDHPLPDCSHYNHTQFPFLPNFYDPTAREREKLRLFQRFIDILAELAGMSHTHPEFAVLHYAATDMRGLRRFHADDMSTFCQIFQDTEELEALQAVGQALKDVARAIDDGTDRTTINTLEGVVSSRLETLPTILEMANRYYLPHIQSVYGALRDTLITADPRTFAGRLALTRGLIHYGELLKTIPSKKAATASKGCIMFRDKAVKVLARRLRTLKDNAGEISQCYEGTPEFLGSLHAFIFEGAGEPSHDPIVRTLQGWGYRPNGKRITTAAAASGSVPDDELEEASLSFVMELLDGMREFSGLSATLTGHAFVSLIHYNPELAPELSTFCADKDFTRKEDFEAVLGWVNAHQEGSAHSYSRSFHVSQLIHLQHLRNLSPFAFAGQLSYQHKVLEDLPVENLEALRLLAYTFTQSIGTSPLLTELFASKDHDRVKKLRNFWAHPGIGEFSWESVFDGDLGSTAHNERNALLVLMVPTYDKVIQRIMVSTPTAAVTS